MAVTLAAQILTAPISVYHFHQFPNLFLYYQSHSSSIIGPYYLFGEILLCAVSLVPPVAMYGLCLLKSIALGSMALLNSRAVFHLQYGRAADQVTRNYLHCMYSLALLHGGCCIIKNGRCLSLIGIIVFYGNSV